MRILLIEDEESDIKVFTDSVAAWNINRTEQAEVEICKTLEDALKRMSSPDNLDGVVLDLKLPQNDNGEEVIKRLQQLYVRIPVVVLSGTPAELAEEYQVVCLKSFVKAGQHVTEILNLLWDCKRSGLMDLIGGKGLFEKRLKTVFDKCIVPRFNEWRNMLKGTSDGDAETTTNQALTRHILSCLNLILSNGTDKIQPEECYLLLPDETISCPRPGMILQSTDNSYYLVLNPACDLAVRADGQPNSNVMLLVPIDSEEEALGNPRHKSSKKDRQRLYENRGALRYHWLPECGCFAGGFANFRNVVTCDSSKFDSEYTVCKNGIMVHPDVLKNIQSRFSNYYARQGQPDIDIKRFLSEGTRDA